MDKKPKENNLSEESLAIYNFFTKATAEARKKGNAYVKRISLNEITQREEDQDYPNSINFA